MSSDDTGRVSESAARAYRVAIQQEIRRLQEELASEEDGGAQAVAPADLRLLGELPARVRELRARLRRLETELDYHQRIEPHLRESLKELKSLAILSRQINSTLEQDEILKLLVELTSEVVPTEGSIVYLYDEASREYEKVVTRRLSDETAEVVSRTLEQGILQQLEEDPSPTITPEIATAMRSGGSERSLILVPLHHRGNPVGLLAILSPEHRLSFFQEDLEILAMLANSVSVAIANARLFEEARRLSVTDDLTQLANSRHMADYLDRAVEEARRNDQRLSLLFTDLDGFKEINDAHGHHMGSAVLVEVAQLLRRCVEAGDLVARFGGDEFVLALPDTEAFKAFLVGEKVRATVAAHRFLAEPGIEARLTISVGVATFPDHADNANDLIARADAAMYVVKNRNKDGVSLSEEVRTA